MTIVLDDFEYVLDQSELRKLACVDDFQIRQKQGLLPVFLVPLDVASKFFMFLFWRLCFVETQKVAENVIYDVIEYLGGNIPELLHFTVDNADKMCRQKVPDLLNSEQIELNNELDLLESEPLIISVIKPFYAFFTKLSIGFFGFLVGKVLQKLERNLVQSVQDHIEVKILDLLKQKGTSYFWLC